MSHKGVKLEVDTAPLRSVPGESTVNTLATGERFDVVTNPHCFAVHTAMLTFLDPALNLRQPILVSIKKWTDGLVEAHLADALLYGTGEDEAESLADLREHILAAWKRLSATPEVSMARPAWRMWRSLSALCSEIVPR